MTPDDPRHGTANGYSNLGCRCADFVTVTDLQPYVLGASMIPAVLDLDPWDSPYALGARLLDNYQHAQSDAATMGLRLEAAHAELVADTYDVMPAPAAGFQHAELPWLVVHPDGIVALDGRASPLELKARGTAPSDAVKTRDTIQATVQVHTMAATRGLVSVLHGGYGGITRDEWTVEADAELFGMIVERCEAFLALLKRGKLPAPSGSDSDREAIRRRFADAEQGKTIRLDQETWQAVRRIRELDEQAATIKAQREKWAQRVQAVMGDATDAVSPYDTLAVRWRPVQSSRLDTKALREAHPSIAPEFTKVSTTRRFEANP